MRSKSDNRTEQLRVYVSPAEKVELEERARATGLTLSTYLCKVGLGFNPTSNVDLDALQDLLRVNADLGRLGGLLKLWLSDRPGEGAGTPDVRALLHEIEKGQAEARSLIKRVQPR